MILGHTRKLRRGDSLSADSSGSTIVANSTFFFWGGGGVGGGGVGGEQELWDNGF